MSNFNPCIWASASISEICEVFIVCFKKECGVLEVLVVVRIDVIKGAPKEVACHFFINELDIDVFKSSTF